MRRSIDASGDATDHLTPTILVVEDDDDVRLLLQWLMKGMGFATLLARTGREAIEALRAPTLPDAVVLDLQIPDVHGWSVLEKIRSHERTAQLPVVLCTAMAGRRDCVRAWKMGCDSYVRKPFDPDHLLAEVRAVLALTPEERTRRRMEALSSALQQ